MKNGEPLPEIDVHGERIDQALIEAERLVQSSFIKGERVLRLIHGKGEGRLRDALHRWLGTHRLVARYQEAAMGGATLVALVER